VLEASRKFQSKGRKGGDSNPPSLGGGKRDRETLHPVLYPAGSPLGRPFANITMETFKKGGGKGLWLETSIRQAKKGSRGRRGKVLSPLLRRTQRRVHDRQKQSLPQEWGNSITIEGERPGENPYSFVRNRKKGRNGKVGKRS